MAINQDYPFAGAGQRIQGSDLTWPCAGGSVPVGAVASVQALPCGGVNANSQFWMFNSTDNTLRLASPPSTTTTSLPPVGVGAALTVDACQSADGTLVYLFPAGSNATGSCGNTNQNWVVFASSKYKCIYH